MVDRLSIKNRSKEILLREKHEPNIFVVTGLYVIIVFILSVIRTYLSDYEELYDEIYNALTSLTIPSLQSIFTVRGTLFYFAATIISAVISFGYTIYLLRITRGEDTTLWTLFEGFEFFFKYIAMYILIGIITVAGMALFIVPGIILSIVFSQAAYILIDNPELSVTSSMRESARLMKGRWKEFFVLELSLLGWYLSSELVIYLLGYFGCVTYLWVHPYMGLIFAQYYNEIQSLCDESFAE